MRVKAFVPVVLGVVADEEEIMRKVKCRECGSDNLEPITLVVQYGFDTDSCTLTMACNDCYSVTSFTYDVFDMPATGGLTERQHIPVE